MNRKQLTTFVGVGVLFVAVVAATKINVAKQLRVMFAGVKIGQAGGFFSFPDIFITFNLVNPTETALKVNNIVGDLFINGNKVSTINDLNPFTIIPNNTTTIQVKVVTPVVSVLQTLISLITNKQKMQARFVGTVNSSGFNIPVNQTINLF